MRDIIIAVVLSALSIVPGATAASAQAWRWSDNGPVEWRPWNGGDRSWERDWGNRYWYEPGPRFERPMDRAMAPPQGAGEIRDGGERPHIEAVAPPIVPFPYDYQPNTIVIDTSGRRLYYVLPQQKAYAYQISVGREGFDWTGTEVVSRKQAWPDWHPPAEMRARDPSLPEKMTGGIRNPLGAMALYLGNTLYRIHGTNDERSLGQASSSGCFRMMNSAVLHLASITEIGTTVVVVRALPMPPMARMERPYWPPADPRAGAMPPPPPQPPPPRAYSRNWDRVPDHWLPDYRPRDYRPMREGPFDPWR